jgi:hypothetical protein
MLPAGAYATLEHEYILIFRKGIKRAVTSPEDIYRRTQSAFFWEERNIWFSDIWDFKGAKQPLNSNKVRERSAAFPFELPYRLINMFSLIGDTILDPFLGTGTTTLAGIAAARNTIGVEVDVKFESVIHDTIVKGSQFVNDEISARLNRHQGFMKKYTEEKGERKHKNTNYSFSVVTSQERNLLLRFLKELDLSDKRNIRSHYMEQPSLRFADPVVINGYSEFVTSGKQLSLNL